MAKKILTDLNLSQNEIQNAVEQNLASAPANPKEGQIYYNTTTKKEYIWNGTSWVDRTSQGHTFNTDDFVVNGNAVSINGTNIVKATQKGANNGVASLGADGKVPSSQLPSYVDDVIELLTMASSAPAECAVGDHYYNTTSKLIFTATATNTWDSGASPERGKIYINLTDNKSYRWGGTTMVEISSTPEHKYTETNPALTASGGICTWTVNHGLGSDVIASVKEVATGEEVYCEVTYGNGVATIKMNASANIAAGTYKVVVIA